MKFSFILRNFNEIFRKDVAYDNIKSHKKPGLYPLSTRDTFGKTTNLLRVNAGIVNNNAFESFKYIAKLLENAVVDGNNTILKNATIAVLLKYLRNFWRSLEMPLINWKVELKLGRTIVS